MISTCPNCLEQIKHDDGVFEVTCTSCQSKFNPFLSPGDIPNLDNLGLGDTGSNSMGTGTDESSGSDSGADALIPSELPAGEASASSDFSESNAMFAELRDFGENLLGPTPAAAGEGQAPASDGEPGSASAAEQPARGASPPPPLPGTGDDLTLTSGDSVPGFQIETLLPPISLWTDVSADTDPLAKAFEEIAARAKQSGGNAVLGMRWALSADSQRVLMSGSPARVVKSA